MPDRIDAADGGAYQFKRKLRGGTLRVYRPPAGLSVADAIAELSASGDVASVGPDLRMSTTESGLALGAPGERILQEINVKDEVKALSGTSMASPHVAAAAALLMSAGASSDEALALLEETALDLGDEGYDREFGSGLIQPAAALELLLEE